MSVVKKNKKSRGKNSRAIISFEEEIVTRNEAEQYLNEESPKSRIKHRQFNNVGRNGGEIKCNEVAKAGIENRLDMNDTLGIQEIHCKGRKQRKKREKHKTLSHSENILDNENLHMAPDKVVKKNGKKHIYDIKSDQETSEVTDSLEATQKKRRKKAKRDIVVDLDDTTSFNNDNASVQISEITSLKESKKQNKQSESENTETETSNSIEELGKKGESIRQQKRMKHQKLLEEKKIKIEVILQQKALEYLSKWKYSRGTWKFEKLRQIWLQQNLFDTAKLPSEFWDSVVEYFTSARGRVKTVLIEKALKMIEENKPAESNDDETDAKNETVDADDEQTIKVKRARDIVQYLQEE